MMKTKKSTLIEVVRFSLFFFIFIIYTYIYIYIYIFFTFVDKRTVKKEV